jgi:hypothetical protein
MWLLSCDCFSLCLIFCSVIFFLEPPSIYTVPLVHEIIFIHIQIRCKIESHVSSVFPKQYIVFVACSVCIPMPQLTPDYNRVVLFGYQTTDMTHYNILNAIKLTQMVMEIRISEDYCFSDIYVLDLQNCSLGHVRQATLPLIRKYELCVLVSTDNFIFCIGMIAYYTNYNNYYYNIHTFRLFTGTRTKHDFQSNNHLNTKFR